LGAQFCTARREERAGIPGVVGAVAVKEPDEEQRPLAVGRRRPSSCPARQVKREKRTRKKKETPE